MPRHLDAHPVLTRLDQFVVTTARSGSSDDRDLPALLRSLVDGALEVVPGASSAGILELSPRGMHSRYTTHPMVEDLDQIACERQEGPVVAASAAPTPAATVITLEDDAWRCWPCWASQARAAGIASALTVTLPVTAGKRPTVLTFYGRCPDDFGQASIAAAQVFAAPITVALQAVDRTQSLQRGLESRDVIGQAKGMLMERHRVGPEEAFSRLVRASQESNVRLVDVAAWLVGKARSASTPEEVHPAPAPRSRANGYGPSPLSLAHQKPPR